MQKAILSSMNTKSYEDALESVLASKQSAESHEVIPKLSGQLEYMARRCHDVILATNSTRKCDTTAMMSLWLDIQNSIGLGFRLMYTAVEQKELLVCLICKADEWLHIFPGVVMGLQRGNTFGFLAGDVFVESEGDDLLGKGTYPSDNKAETINTARVCSMLMQLRLQHFTVKHVITEMLLQGDFEPTGSVTSSAEGPLEVWRDSSLLAEDGHKFALLSSSVSLLQMSLSYFLIQKVGTGSLEKPLHKVWGPHMAQLFSTIVESIENELRDITDCLPALSRWCDSEVLFERLQINLTKILRNSVSCTLLDCVGGIATSSSCHIENTLFFLPYARELLTMYNYYFSSLSNMLHGGCNTMLVEFIQDWLLNEMRCMILFVSSTVGLYSRAASDSSLGDEKFTLSNRYRPRVWWIIDVDAASMAHDGHSVWWRLSSCIKAWSQLAVTAGAERADYLPRWKTILDIMCSDSLKGWDAPSLTPEIKWFASVVLARTPQAAFHQYDIPDTDTACSIFNTDRATYEMITSPTIESSPKETASSTSSRDFIAKLECDHGALFVCAFKDWLRRLKLETYALLITLSGEHRDIGDDSGDIKVSPQTWILCTVLLSIVLEKIRDLSATSSVEQTLSYMNQGMSSHMRGLNSCF